MTVRMRPLHEINRDGHAALVHALGVVGALRFLGPFATGRGNYTAEREAYLGGETLEELFERVQEEDVKRNT